MLATLLAEELPVNPSQCRAVLGTGRRSAQAGYCFRRADCEDTYDCHLLYREVHARRRLVVMRTLHLGLRVADPERSIAFYTSIGYEVLGDVPATELGTFTMLKLPGDEFVALELVHNPADGRVERSGLSHFVIQVEDMHATMAHLAARGVQADEPGSPDGSADFWTAWVTDPDGYRIELVQWPDGHPDGMTRFDLADPGQSR